MVQTADATREAILRSIRANLASVPDAQLAAVTDPDSVGAQMARVLPGVGECGRLIGPVYSTKALMAMWGVSRAAVSKKAKAAQLLALKVERENLFPVFQFHEGRVREDVMEVVGALRGHVDPFTIAQWLRTPQAHDADNRTPLELLDAGKLDDVLSAARATAARWQD